MDNDGILRKVAQPTTHKLAVVDKQKAARLAKRALQMEEMAASHPDATIAIGARQALEETLAELRKVVGVAPGTKLQVRKAVPQAEALTSRGIRQPQLANVAPASTVDSTEHDHLHQHTTEGGAVIEHRHPHIHGIRHDPDDNPDAGIHDHHHVDGKATRVELSELASLAALAEDRDFYVRQHVEQKLAGIWGVPNTRPAASPRTVTKAHVSSAPVLSPEAVKVIQLAVTKGVGDLVNRIAVLQQRSALPPRKL
jgi:hypothetical protein